MIKRILNAIWHWKLFSIALLGLIIGIILYILGYHLATNVLLGIISIIELLPILWDMLSDLRNGHYGIDILAATAILASVLLHQYWAAIVVVIMLTGGESLDDYADHRAKRELNSLIKNSPQTAHLIKNKKVIDVSVSELKPGDKFIVKPGELVPVDAIVTEGTSSFDEASLTGESNPVVRIINDKLLSGSINLEGVITAKATASAKDSQYQQIIKLVQSAASSQSPFVRLADRYSIPFTLLAYAIAGTVWYLTGQPIRFLEVIIVATPCPLLLAAPIALVSGMSLSSKNGIIVKTGAALEKLAEARTIAFDKTGTLTTGELTVDKVLTFNNYSKNEVLSYAASLEQFSTHIIAKSISNYSIKNKIKLLKVKKISEISGKGLLANYKGQKISVGKTSLLIGEKVQLPKKLDLKTINSTTVFVAIDQKLMGYITLNDSIRQDSKNTLRKLQSNGLEDILMITGDNPAAANLIAKSLGIKQVVSEALPVDKLNAIEKITKRPVVFVGDGVNDAPVLTASDVGIALGAKGSTAASESADMVIMEDDISKVYVAYKISLRTFKVAKQSILSGIGLSLILMLVFATGKFIPIYGAILQEVVDVVVIFNALRAHSIKDLN